MAEVKGLIAQIVITIPVLSPARIASFRVDEIMKNITVATRAPIHNQMKLVQENLPSGVYKNTVF